MLYSLWGSLITNSTIVLLHGCGLIIHRTWRAAQSLSSDLCACWPKPQPTDLPSLKLVHCCCASSRHVRLVSRSFPTNTMFLIFPVGSERLNKSPMVTWANLRARMVRSLQL